MQGSRNQELEGTRPPQPPFSFPSITSFSAHKIFTSRVSKPRASSLFTIICKLPCELHPCSIKSSGRCWKRQRAEL